MTLFRIAASLMALLSFPLLLFLHDAEPGEKRWKLIGKSVTGTLWYVDNETITHPTEHIVAVWVKSVPDKNRAGYTGEKEETEVMLKRIQERYFGEYEFTEGLWELDCSKSLFRLLYFSAYDGNGRSIASMITPDAEWSCILPGSAGEAVSGALCNHPPYF